MSDGVNAAQKWDIALSAWIIQDGNYPDFYVGQAAEFALEFWIPEGARIEPTSTPISAVYQQDCLYDAVAEVVLRTDAVTVLDIGILIYRETPSLESYLVGGSRYALQLGLGVDPFFYFETLGRIAEIPPLIYSWRILSIARQTAPFVDMVVKGQRIRRRDEQRWALESVPATRAWTDDDGYGEYTLRCGRLAIPPKRATATVT